MKAVDAFKALASQDCFRGWPVVGEPQIGAEIPSFGRTLDYHLETDGGVEPYTAILRNSGRAVCFGLTVDMDVVTLCQWKPGVNQASWELPPGDVGKIAPDATIGAIAEQTRRVYLAETGYGHGIWVYLGHILIETGKYRGASPDDHGFKAHLFLASGLEEVQEGKQSRPNKIMRTLKVPLVEWKEVLDSGLFVEESAVACAYKALVRMDLLRW